MKHIDAMPALWYAVAGDKWSKMVQVECLQGFDSSGYPRREPSARDGDGERHHITEDCHGPCNFKSAYSMSA